jgi:hypothetical protein
MNAIKYFTKMMATCSETIVFMFLGLSTIHEALQSTDHSGVMNRTDSDMIWDPMFIGATLLFAFIYRMIGNELVSYFKNFFCFQEYS